jgi:hypothetical protein
LIEAAKAGDVTNVKTLLESQDADVNAKDKVNHELRYSIHPSK